MASRIQHPVVGKLAVVRSMLRSAYVSMLSVKVDILIGLLANFDRNRVDVRKKVEYSLPDEQVHILAELELLCHSVHLKGMIDELGDNEHTHQSTKQNLEAIDNFG